MPLAPNPVKWFEIPVRDMQRATAFYEKAFDTKLTANEVHGLQLAFFTAGQEGYGIGGALIYSPPIEPSHLGTTVYFGVENIEAALAAIEAAGGKTLIPRMDIGQYGYMAQFEDSEGNRVALHEAPKKAM